MAVPKPMLTEFGIYYILESCVRSLLKAIDLKCAIIFAFLGFIIFISGRDVLHCYPRVEVRDGRFRPWGSFHNPGGTPDQH